MKSISKGKIFGVTTIVSDELLRNLRRTPEILQKANAAGAAYWHDGILPKHFVVGASAKYGYAQRSVDYLKQRRKRGKPPLVMSGSMRREMLHNRQITATATGAKLKLTARVLNLAPNMPDGDQDFYVKHSSKNGGKRDYPNLKREVRLVLEDEREAVAQVVAKTIQEEMKPTANQE